MAEDTEKTGQNEEHTGKEALQRGSYNFKSEFIALQRAVEDLRVRYEQCFAGILPQLPEKEHNEVERTFRVIRKAPFKSTEQTYQLKGLEHRFSTYKTYWSRVLREREVGVYVKDVFKAEMRDKQHQDTVRAKTRQGTAEKGMRALYDAYRQTLEKQSGKIHDVDFKVFQSTLARKAREFREQTGSDKITFKIQVKDGKVSVQAKAVE